MLYFFFLGSLIVLSILLRAIEIIGVNRRGEIVPKLSFSTDESIYLKLVFLILIEAMIIVVHYSAYILNLLKSSTL